MLALGSRNKEQMSPIEEEDVSDIPLTVEVIVHDVKP